jgi:hypothetical protein
MSQATKEMGEEEEKTKERERYRLQHAMYTADHR